VSEIDINIALFSVNYSALNVLHLFWSCSYLIKVLHVVQCICAYLRRYVNLAVDLISIFKQIKVKIQEFEGIEQ
jgi:hypothetical protein